MRYRLLAFFPFAALITTVLLMSASSFVSALEASVTADANYAIQVQRYESNCDVIDRKIQEISRMATGCDDDLQCLYSPILCPITMDHAQELEYMKLRREWSQQCGSELDRVGGGLRGTDSERASCCSKLRPAVAGASGRSAGVATFVF